MYHVWQKLYGKKNRDEHMSIHLDELKNECQKCGKKYRWHSSLSKHMNVKHPPTPHPTPERSPSPEFQVTSYLSIQNYRTSWSYT